MIIPTFDRELEIFDAGYDLIVGIDEAGRGPWAGPVVAGVVVLARDIEILQGVRDSKTLSANQRKRIVGDIRKQSSSYGLGEVPNFEIDEIGIVASTQKAMQLAFKDAVGKLSEAVSTKKIYALVDGYFTENIDLGVEEEHIGNGDKKHYSIAAASILAKVHRDRILVGMDKKYPEYGFKRHKGYGTRAHLEALAKHGASDVHRLSFKPVMDFLLEDVEDIE